MNRMILLIEVCSIILLNTACGRNYAGTYTGTATFTVNGASTSGPVTIALTNQNSGVSGTLSGQVGTGNVTAATASGDTLSNVSLTFTPTANNGSAGVYPNTGVGGYPNAGYPNAGYPNAGYPSAGVVGGTSLAYCGSMTFSGGTITIANKNLQGSLTSTGASSSTMGINCTGTISLNATTQ